MGVSARIPFRTRAHGPDCFTVCRRRCAPLLATLPRPRPQRALWTQSHFAPTVEIRAGVHSSLLSLPTHASFDSSIPEMRESNRPPPIHVLASKDSYTSLPAAGSNDDCGVRFLPVPCAFGGAGAATRCFLFGIIILSLGSRQLMGRRQSWRKQNFSILR